MPGVKKKGKDGPIQTTKPQRGKKVQHPSLVTSALDGSCVVSFTPRSLYSAGKRPCIGLNYEVGRAPDPVRMSCRSLDLPGFENRDRPARCLVTILTILKRLEHCDCIFSFLFFAICERHIPSKTNTRSYRAEHNYMNIKNNNAMKEL